ncbi:hypothetical protein HDU93_006756, partial [Gonapodya sp. JEL0774]
SMTLSRTVRLARSVSSPPDSSTLRTFTRPLTQTELRCSLSSPVFTMNPPSPSYPVTLEVNSTATALVVEPRDVLPLLRAQAMILLSNSLET